MRIVDLTGATPERVTVVLYGQSRAGKTEHAATYPRPVFLADATEAGWDTIAHMDRAKFWEPKLWPKFPEVREISGAPDMLEQVAALELRVRNNPGEVQTIVIDTISSYAEMYLARLERTMAEAPVAKQGGRWTIYSNLFQHLRTLVARVHAIPTVNVVWVAHAKAPSEDGDLGGLQLPGKMGGMLPTLVNCWFYQRVFQQGKDLVYEARTRQFGIWPAGHRFGTLLPDSLAPTYRALMSAMSTKLRSQDSDDVVPCAASPAASAAAPVGAGRRRALASRIVRG